jgi:flagellar biosynthesis GTPase FlhF
MTAQIAPKGQARIGPEGIGKKTALAMLAATRMAAITTVKISNLRIAFFVYVKVPGAA